MSADTNSETFENNFTESKNRSMKQQSQQYVTLRTRNKVKTNDSTINFHSDDNEKIVPQTPRRSARKSIRTKQDYVDIVRKSASRFNHINSEEESESKDQSQPRWTPAKVGRVSQKRTRRSRRMREQSKKTNQEESLMETSDMEEKIKDDNEEERNISNTIITRSGRCLKTTLKQISNDSVTEHDNEEEKVNVEKNKLRNIRRKTKPNSKKNLIDETNVEIQNAIQSESEIIEKDEYPERKEQFEDENKKSTAINNEHNFGANLNAHNNDFSDLGVMPLEDEGNSSITENMTPEITKIEISAENKVVCLDDNTVNQEILEELEKVEEEVEEVEYLLLSDDDSNVDEVITIEATPFLPKIVLTDTDQLSETIHGTPHSAVNNKSPELVAKRRHVPTPFKQQKRNSIEIIEDHDLSTNDNLSDSYVDPKSISIQVTTLPSKEIVLKSIRKRSLSICIGDEANIEKKRHTGRVTFYSPANQTTCIEDLDIQIAKSTTKVKISPKEGKNMFSNVKLQCKRSLSANDGDKVSRTTPLKERKEKPVMRSRLPNFAAIHKKRFDQMENIVEHLARKKNRADWLSNSASKLKLPEANKSLLSPKNRYSPKRYLSRAHKRIDMNKLGIPVRAQGISDSNQRNMPKPIEKGQLKNTKSSELQETAIKQINSSLPHIQAAVVVPTRSKKTAAAAVMKKRCLDVTLSDEMSFLDEAALKQSNPGLPFIKPGTTISTVTSNAKPPSKQNSNNAVKSNPINPKRILKPKQDHNNVAKPVTVSSEKPSFNLSTQVNKPFIFSAPKQNNVSSIKSFNQRVDTVQEKVTARRQRHLDMYKGRPANASDRLNATNVSTIRGVRSNRRFELQMQHRLNRMDNN